MRSVCVYYAGTNRHLLKNYYSKINLLQYPRKLQILATEMFKVYRNISPTVFSEIFHRRDVNYNVRINSDFAMPNVRSVFHGSESILYLGLKIWDIVNLELKELTSVVAFKKGIKE